MLLLPEKSFIQYDTTAGLSNPGNKFEIVIIGSMFEFETVMLEFLGAEAEIGVGVGIGVLPLS